MIGWPRVGIVAKPIDRQPKTYSNGVSRAFDVGLDQATVNAHEAITAATAQNRHWSDRYTLRRLPGVRWRAFRAEVTAVCLYHPLGSPLI